MSTTITSIAQISSQPDVLKHVRDEACSLSIWERQPTEQFDRLLGEKTRDIRLNASRTTLRSALAAALISHYFSAPELHSRLIDDVAQLAAICGEILAIDEFELRLEVVTTDSCRKFHADYVTARLISTYVGDGTQWLEGGDAERLREGHQPTCIHCLKAGDVGIFKGKIATDRPAIHRSPPIAGTGQKRLLLVLNPIEK